MGMKELENELYRHYALLLGIKSPWQVNAIKLDVEGKGIEIALGWREGAAAPCPECGKLCPLADHAPERKWRHLDVMQFETLLRARVPRSRCREHGVKNHRRVVGGAGLAFYVAL